MWQDVDAWTDGLLRSSWLSTRSFPGWPYRTRAKSFSRGFAGKPLRNAKVGVLDQLERVVEPEGAGRRGVRAVGASAGRAAGVADPEDAVEVAVLRRNGRAGLRPEAAAGGVAAEGVAVAHAASGDQRSLAVRGGVDHVMRA